MLDVSPLFRPLAIRGRTCRNRIVVPPMVSLRDIIGADGIEWYRRLAAGGPGLVIVEATGVDGFGKRLTAASLKPLVDVVHDAGALIAIQLFPIPFGCREGRFSEPNALSPADIKEVLDGYETAARVCAEAGFDGVEPHGAHGFLLNQFFSPERNQRPDEYGGSLSNRMRLGLEIVQTVRRTMPDDRLVLYRHTPVWEGYGMEESLQFAAKLVEAGVDVLDISPASDDAPADRAEAFRCLGVPVIAVNDMDVVERALDALNEERADLIAVARGLIADPQWPNKVRDGRLDEITTCIKCDAMCFGNLDKGIPIACVQWD